MIKRMGRLLICVLLAAVLTTEVLAADPSAMRDIRDHWARDAIYYAMVEGLFSGVSDTEFAPDLPMSRAMYVTVLGRLAGIDQEEYRTWYLDNLYGDVDSGQWYAPYVCWATRYGITNGVEGGMFAPDAPITREQMATMTVRFASIYNYEISASGEPAAWAFTDWDTVSEFARDAVETLRLTGIMNGALQPDGTYAFQPRELASRAQCATIMSRLSRGLRPYTDRIPVDPASIILAADTSELQVGDYTNLTASVAPANATNQTITWFSTDRSVATVANGVVTAVSPGTADIYCMTWNGCELHATITVAEPKPAEEQPEEPQPIDPTPQDMTLGHAGESFEEKCLRIFGTTASRSDYQGYYVGKGDGHITGITVPVWQFADYTHTEKTTGYITLYVHKNIASTVQAIFQEIYDSSERFPIYAAGAYRSNEYSEHGLGVAIDINPTENGQFTLGADGSMTPTADWFWKPGENDYSIPADSQLVQIFRKYGFGWGGTDWRSSRDYMHFSYFGW